METTLVMTLDQSRGSHGGSQKVPKGSAKVPMSLSGEWEPHAQMGTFWEPQGARFPCRFARRSGQNRLPWEPWEPFLNLEEVKRVEVAYVREANKERGPDPLGGSQGSQIVTPGVARVAIDAAAMSGNVRSWNVGRRGNVTAETERTCATCGESLPIDRFYRTGIQRSCRACVERARTANREANRKRQRARWQRQRELQRLLAAPVKAVREYGRDDRCIVWEPGPGGFCEFVTAQHCPCDVFATHQTCAHHRRACELLEDRRAA